MKIKTFYLTTILSSLVIIAAIFHSYNKGWLNKEAFLYFNVGLLTFIGIFYGVLWSQGFKETTGLKKTLKTIKDKKIKEAVKKYNDNVKRGSDIFSELSNELNELEAVEKRLNINRFLLFNVIGYIITILLYILLPLQYFAIVLLSFSITILFTITLITTLFFIKDFEENEDIE